MNNQPPLDLADLQRKRICSAGKPITGKEVYDLSNSVLRMLVLLLALGSAFIFWPASLLLFMLLLATK